MSVLETLTEGIRQRSLANEGEALLEKWEKTGLLEGLDEQKAGSMARLFQLFAVYSATLSHKTSCPCSPCRFLADSFSS